MTDISCGVYVGNLRPELRYSELKDHLCSLVAQTGLDIRVSRKDVDVTKKAYIVYAFIHVCTSSQAQDLIQALEALTQKPNDLVNLITAAGKTIKVAPLYDKRRKHESPKDYNAGISAVTKSKESVGNRSCLEPIAVESDAPILPNENKRPVNKKLQINDGSESKSKSDSALAEKPAATFPMHRDFYDLEEILGTETRFVEFKQGRGGYVDRQLKDHVAKYTCGFLNSDGGTLLIGVTDDGVVEGVECNRQLEDRLRLQIDSVIKGISPPIFSNMYQVHFIQIIHKKIKPIRDLKVIEVSVLAGQSDRLYQTQEGCVYVRRDGSVQGPLPAAHIQEWTRRNVLEEQRQRAAEIKSMLAKEQETMNSVKTLDKYWHEEIATLRQKEQTLSSDVDRLRKNEEALKDQINELTLERERLSRKSKVCIIL